MIDGGPWQNKGLNNVRVKLVKIIAELEADCLKIGRAPWPGRHHKAELAGGSGDAMQAKEKKLGRKVSMKSLKGAHIEVELQNKLRV